jgi:ribosomal protein L3 glutamine methyltransferase
LKKRRTGPFRRKPHLRAPAIVTVAALIRSIAAQLKRAKIVFAHGTDDPTVEAAFLVGETLGIHPHHVPARASMAVTAVQQRNIAALVARRIRARRPAAYLLGCTYMRGVRFAIDERAIVPRSYLGEILDSELLVGEAYSLIPDADSVRSVLDLCTGSGCLAILAALRFSKANVDAVELSKDALAVARKNVTAHRLKARVRLLCGDLFAPVKSERYDLIVANPPYVDEKGMASLPPECRHEPQMAFDGGSDGLSLIRRILDEAGRHLKQRGGLLCEVGRCRPALERAYPGTEFLWLDTEASEGEVFWLDANQLR